MAHYAKLDENNIVLSLHSVDDDKTLNNGIEDEATGIAYLTKVHGWPHWKRYSYHMRNGVRITHDGFVEEDQSRAFRKNIAVIGGTYDPVRDAFIEPKPYPSWVLNETTCCYEAPIPKPSSQTNGFPDRYIWNEETQSFDKEVIDPNTIPG